MPAKKLTNKQLKFVDNYIKNGCNATQAALNAGYSENFADSRSYTLVNHPVINELLSNAHERAEDAAGISAEFKMNVLLRLIRAYENSPLAQDAKVVISAIAELNRMCGHYEPSKRLNVNVDTTLERMAEVRIALRRVLEKNTKFFVGRGGGQRGGML